MERDRFLQTLTELGLDATNYRALELLPLVYVAWASGTVTKEREERLFDVARAHFALDEACERVLRAWLHRRPADAYFERGLRELVLIARAPDDMALGVDELPSLIAYSEAVARATAAAMDAPDSVTEAEQRALRELSEILEVDEGESWAAVLRALDPPPGTRLAPAE
jgi:hypothetical protein